MHDERARYFVITSNTKENVVQSVRHGLWATQRKNEQRLDEAFRTSPTVILVFSVNRSDAFQGYARMRSPIGRPRFRGIDPFNGFGRLFDVEWLRLHDLHYREVEALRNPLNGDRPVQFSRDGQELTNSVGRQLCGLIDRHIDEPDSFRATQPRVQQPRGPSPIRMQPPQGQPPVQSTNGTAASSPAAYSSLAAAQVPVTGRSTAKIRQSSSSNSSSLDSAGNRKRRRKRRREERKHRHAPHPLTADLDKQLDFFLSLDYEDYVKWWKRFGTVNPGPLMPMGAVQTCQPPVLMASLPGSVMHPVQSVVTVAPSVGQQTAPCMQGSAAAALSRPGVNSEHQIHPMVAMHHGAPPVHPSQFHPPHMIPAQHPPPFMMPPHTSHPGIQQHA